jgi:hypothetical protein
VILFHFVKSYQKWVIMLILAGYYILRIVLDNNDVLCIFSCIVAHVSLHHDVLFIPTRLCVLNKLHII